MFDLRETILFPSQDLRETLGESWDTLGELWGPSGPDGRLQGSSGTALRVSIYQIKLPINRPAAVMF